MAKKLKIALIPGDGIGMEVMPEGVRVLEAAASKHDLTLDWQDTYPAPVRLGFQY